MSCKRRTTKAKNVRAATRRSARLSAHKKDTQLVTKFERNVNETNLERNANSCPVINRSSRRLRNRRISSSKAAKDASIIVDDSTESSQDASGSEKTLVKTLTFSSSDSSVPSKRKSCAQSKMLQNSIDQGQLDKEIVKDKQSSDKSKTEGHEEMSRDVIQRSQPKNTYNLRSRVTASVLSETPESCTDEEPKVIIVRRTRKTKMKEKKAEIHEKSDALLHKVDGVMSKMQKSKNIAISPSFTANMKVEVIKESVKCISSRAKKTGTLTRKRELRDMLEKQDVGYEDDAFEGTPFRNRKSLLKCKLSPIIFDSSILTVSADDSGFKTPNSRTPVSHLRPAGPLSTASSESDVMTPGLLHSVNRNYIDRYVNQLKRRKIRLGRKKAKTHCTPLPQKASSVILQRKACDFDFANGTNDFAETDVDEDYYWSDTQ